MTSRRKWVWRAALALGAAVLSLAGWAATQRYVLKNFHTVVEGQVYRSAQPSAANLRAWKERYGLRSVLTLQGYSGTKAVIEERQVVESLGMSFASNYMSSDRLPATFEVTNLLRLLETLPQPVLIHCRGGVDRTGFASVLAAMSVGGQDYRSALSHLSIRYLRMPSRGPDINGLFREYETDCGRAEAAPGDWNAFRTWLGDVYRPSYYHARIEVPTELTLGPGEIRTLQAVVTNGSHRILPLSDLSRRFDLIAMVRTEDSIRWTTGLWGRATLSGPDVPPGGSCKVSLRIQAPRESGATVLCFDLEEVEKDRFAIYGSPMPTCTVTVK